MGLAGMLSGLSETVGTETFQEFLAMGRAWLKQQSQQPIFPGFAVPASGPIRTMESQSFPDGLLDLEKLSVRAKKFCEAEGWTTKRQIVEQPYAVLLYKTKIHNPNGRTLPKIAGELMRAALAPDVIEPAQVSA